ncbi:hypothetical protein K227x_15520 [Rubripirellula lacrimiformis]|uniref:Uncharacterized protein n=1 Tax=Rubripirellula lacrimiformis TaxID=1930273 RepID=A0A517N7T4_9BACT|nr:hypothetical protein [Rubripirellula lacrimiformis]QDT03170.1 hypothetical protein K227x_15520 [Rubripirellula lacrimiformis]
MAASNVRSIEALEVFHDGLIGLSGDWDKTLQEVRMLVHRAEEYFSQDRPKYWRHQVQLAERYLNEAKDQLAQKRSAVRASDRPAATEAVKRVQVAERRLRLTQAKVREAKAYSIEVSQACNAVLGPLADVAQHCEVLLPTAALELHALINQLKAYADRQ